MLPKDFADKFGPVCIEAQKRNGGFASVRLGQIALESGWAKYVPVDIYDGRYSYNLTGVKGEGPAGFVTCWSDEWNPITKKMEPYLSDFRAYHSYEQHIIERDRIFLWSNYDGYRSATTPWQACWALQNAPMPYATDPDYATKLIATITANNFTRFDAPFLDTPNDAWYAQDLRELKDGGFLKGDDQGRLAISPEGIRLLVIMNRIRKTK